MRNSLIILFLSGLLLSLCGSMYANSAGFFAGDEQHDIIIRQQSDSSLHTKMERVSL